MDETVIYREMKLGEEGLVSALALAAFRTFVGHEYCRSAIELFQEYVAPKALRQRQVDHRVWVALRETAIVGMIETRQYNHISLLFVDERFHRRGIARSLLTHALAQIRSKNPQLEVITVHSSRYAVPIYERLGFHPIDGEQNVKGIIFIPMMMPLG